MDNLRSPLRSAGYPEKNLSEVGQVINTLASYGGWINPKAMGSHPAHRLVPWARHLNVTTNRILTFERLAMRNLSPFRSLQLARGLPYNMFGILDVSDPGKQVLVEDPHHPFFR